MIALKSLIGDKCRREDKQEGPRYRQSRAAEVEYEEGREKTSKRELHEEEYPRRVASGEEENGRGHHYEMEHDPRVLPQGVCSPKRQYVEDESTNKSGRRDVPLIFFVPDRDSLYGHLPIIVLILYFWCSCCSIGLVIGSENLDNSRGELCPI